MKNGALVSMARAIRHRHVSENTVDRWIDQRGRPAHKVGRQRKFRISEVDDWVLAGKAVEKVRNE